MSDAYLKYWRNYAVFSERSCRKEYWWAVVINVLLINVLNHILPFALGFASAIFFPKDSDTLILICSLFCTIVYFSFLLSTIIPSLALCIRRLHDTDHSGWWLLIFFIPIVDLYLFYLLCLAKGTDGDNRYGADPLAHADPIANTDV